MKTALIALGGKFTIPERVKQQLEDQFGLTGFDEIIGVDSGCHLLKALGLEPTHILGDFDSIGNLSEFQSYWQSAQVHTFRAEKDETDAELAFILANELMLERLIILGAFGGRVDHMLSVFFMASQKKEVTLIDEWNCVKCFTAPFESHVTQGASVYVSLVPLTELKGVSLLGFKYPLSQATIPFASTLGVSNELISDRGKITIQSGSGFLIFSRDA
ncbi:MAG: thiamine diphosphokinase [Clostridiales bacterium 38-18]|nr:MAG: thiamine diphosphokinase [Clostridiales bacterium 38-18]